MTAAITEIQETAGHCASCTCPAESSGAFCDATIARLHETFGCLEPDSHAGRHVGGLVGFPECEHCKGLDVHSNACPTPDALTVGFAHVEWTADGTLEVVKR